MSIVTKRVNIVLNGNNLEYYENLGYPIPRSLDNRGRNRIPQGTSINVCVEDLLPNTRIDIECKCDGCGKPLFIKYCDYNKRKKNDGSSYCQQCGISLFGTENARLSRLKNRNTVYNWCVDNNRQDILNRWDKRNKYKPEELTPNSKKMVLFLCALGIHESELKNIGVITSNNLSCDCKQCNTLGCKFPESIYIWSDKNELTPFDYSYGTTQYVYWKCENGIHEDYRRNINNASYANFHCPECVKLNKESSLQKKVFEYLSEISDKYNLEYNQEFKTRLICRNNIKSSYILPYDNEIIGNNFGLIVEVNGEQHTKITSWHKSIAIRDGMNSAQEVLDYQIERDRYKKEYALNNGYYYLVLPYFTEKSGEWKELLDDMFEEIFNK